jgi:hypothetical protein
MSLLDDDDIVMNVVELEGEREKIKWFMRNYCNMMCIDDANPTWLRWNTNRNRISVEEYAPNLIVGAFYTIENISGKLYIKILTCDDDRITNLNKCRFAISGYPNKELPWYIRFILEDPDGVMLMLNCNYDIDVPFKTMKLTRLIRKSHNFLKPYFL